MTLAFICIMLCLRETYSGSYSKKIEVYTLVTKELTRVIWPSRFGRNQSMNGIYVNVYTKLVKTALYNLWFHPSWTLSLRTEKWILYMYSWTLQDASSQAIFFCSNAVTIALHLWSICAFNAAAHFYDENKQVVTSVAIALSGRLVGCRRHFLKYS